MDFKFDLLEEIISSYAVLQTLCYTNDRVIENLEKLFFSAQVNEQFNEPF